MVTPAIISIRGTQRLPGEKPEIIELVTEGSYCFEPGYATLSYVETQMTGLEGVVTTFTVEDAKTVTLRRTGKINSTIVFVSGTCNESLYNAEGVGALLLGVQTRSMTVLLNENGGILDLEYAVEIEHTVCGVNAYHIEIRVL